MNYASIKKADSANGLGVRVSLFVSGCTNHCKGCFNAETWDFNFGTPYTDDVQNEILEELSKSWYSGLSLLGGDPMEPCNQAELLPLVKKFKELYPDKTIWAWTGFIYDKDLIPGGRRYTPGLTDEFLKYVDVLVDGPFIEAQKNLTLEFRGSANQRVIDLNKTRESGKLSFMY